MSLFRKICLRVAIVFVFSFPLNINALQFSEEAIEPHFAGYTGCFVLYDMKRDKHYFYNKRQCQKRLSPCSTYKIFNSLVGLQTGVVQRDTVFKWDGKPKAFKSWEQDHSLPTAIKYSVVWFFQKLAGQVGETKMQQYVNAAQYGNRDISSGITNFWHNANSLKLSAVEQVKMLSSLYRDQLPFRKDVMHSVKVMLVLDIKGWYKFSGKTGSGLAGERTVLGWFVGHVENKSREFVIATNIQGEDKAHGRRAKQISKRVITHLGIAPIAHKKMLWD